MLQTCRKHLVLLMRFDRRQKVNQGTQQINCGKGQMLVECVTFRRGWRHQGVVQKRARKRQQIATLALCTEQRGLWGEQITEICVLELAAFPLPTANWCDLLGGGHRRVLVIDTKWQWPIKLYFKVKQLHTVVSVHVGAIKSVATGMVLAFWGCFWVLPCWNYKVLTGCKEHNWGQLWGNVLWTEWLLFFEILQCSSQY